MSHVEESSDPYPFSQVDRAAKPKAALLAGVMGTTTQHAIGSLVEFWDLNGEPRALEAMVAEGKEAVVLTPAEAANRWHLASGKELDPAMLASLGFLEPVSGGYRVRGMSRFFRVAKKRVSRRQAGQKGGLATAEIRRHTAPDDTPPKADSSPVAGFLLQQTASKTAANGVLLPVCLPVATANGHLDVRGQTSDDIVSTYVRPPVALVAAPSTPPDEWQAEDFFAWAQSRRLASELPPERPPNPRKLSSWWSEARMAAPASALQEAYYRFAEDKFWKEQAPPWPFAGFITQWDRFLPAGVSYAT